MLFYVESESGSDQSDSDEDESDSDCDPGVRLTATLDEYTEMTRPRRVCRLDFVRVNLKSTLPGAHTCKQSTSFRCVKQSQPFCGLDGAI